jgi:elongation factor 1 alpha-like protein
VRLPVQDVFKGRQGGTCVGGKLEAGALRPGSRVLVVPGYVTATVKGLEVNSQVGLGLRGSPNLAAEGSRFCFDTILSKHALLTM